METNKPKAFAGIDIGGTLAKFSLWVPNPDGLEIESKEELSSK